MILAIETSCDDTCVAVLDGAQVKSNIVSSQAEFHDRYGGVVPEVASRQHLMLIDKVTDDALEQADCGLSDINTVAVTQGPGLIGALLIGLSTAKALAFSLRVPLIPVNHLYGHIAANYLLDSRPKFPFLCLIASGGHTLLAKVDGPAEYRFIGSTLDDAAGEAFDKGARLLGLPYPGGVHLDRLAVGGSPTAFDFPVGMRNHEDKFNFSFSGLKTSLAYRLKKMDRGEIEREKADIAASYQEAICRQLVEKCVRAISETAINTLAIGGGVAANSELRRQLRELSGVELTIPPVSLCTDNAAMIASAARHLPPTPYPQFLSYDAFAAST